MNHFVTTGATLFIVTAAHAGLPEPLPDDRSNLSGTVITCTVDDDCQGEAVCRGGSCYVPRQRYLAIKPTDLGATTWTYRISLDTGPSGLVVLGFTGASIVKVVLGPGQGTHLWSKVVSEAEAEYVDWFDAASKTGAPYLYIGDCEIQPSYTYVVQAIEVGADTTVEANYSPPLVLPTSSFGDCTGGPNAPAPDGAANLIDAYAALKGFQNEQYVPKDWLDLEPPSGPDFNFGLSDVFWYVIAFQRNPFPLTPEDCP